MIIGHVADRVEQLCSDKIVMLPVQWLGHSPHHRRFACVSLDLMPYIDMIRGCAGRSSPWAPADSAAQRAWRQRHPCKAALRELKSEFEDLHDLYIAYATYWNLAAAEFMHIRESPSGGMGHACEMETSIILARHPEQVDMSKPSAGGQARRMATRRSTCSRASPTS